MSGALRYVWFCLCMCGISLTLSAQQYRYVHYHPGTGAPFDQATTVSTDAKGFLWIGSTNGLYRFDGNQFELLSGYTKSQHIHRLIQSEGRLLFTNDLGVYQIEDVLGSPKVAPVIEGTMESSNDLPSFPNDVFQARDQTLWISQSNHQIGKWKAGTFQQYPFQDSEFEQSWNFQEDASYRLWGLSSLSGLYQYLPSQDTFIKKLDLKNGHALLFAQDHLLIGGEELNIYSLKGEDLRLLRTIPLEEDRISTLNRGLGDQILIGTAKGQLFSLSDLRDDLTPIYGSNEAHRVESLNFGHVHDIYPSMDSLSQRDQLWVCSETGLWLLQERFFNIIRELPMVNPISVSVGSDGKAWVPMNNTYQITPDDGEFIAKTVFPQIQVSAIAQDKKGYTWVSTSYPTISIRKYYQQSLIRQFDNFPGREEGIFSLYPDSKGNVWFCQAPSDKPIYGIAVIDSNGTLKYYDQSNGCSSRILALKESSRGEIYAAGIGENGFLYRYDEEKDQFENVSPSLPFNPRLNFEAHDLTIDDRGVVWLATTDGLLRYDGENISLIQNDMLGQEEIRGVTHYSNDNIWVSTATKGLVFLEGDAASSLGEWDGLPAPINAYRCLSTDAEGRLWAGTAEGLVYSRKSASTLPLSHSPIIRGIRINQDDYSPREGEVLEVHRGQQLTLSLTNLSFPADHVQYQYRLLTQIDEQVTLEDQFWKSNGRNPILTIRQLDPDEYSLEIRARQPGGFQWSTPLNIHLQVLVPWYQKTWIQILSGTVVILLILYFIFFVAGRRIKQLKQFLQDSNNKLVEKEALLDETIREYKMQGQALDHATINFQTLELFIKEIPQQASWNDIITAMGKAVDQAPEVDAFEIAFKENDEIVHKGYSALERSGYTFRAKEFNSRTSLTCWAMDNNKEILISDFDQEHTQYIDKKAGYRFRSLLFIPFALSNDQPVVLCAYSSHSHHFVPNDMVMFRVLARFITLSIHRELTKLS